MSYTNCACTSSSMHAGFNHAVYKWSKCHNYEPIRSIDTINSQVLPSFSGFTLLHRPYMTLSGEQIISKSPFTHSGIVLIHPLSWDALCPGLKVDSICSPKLGELEQKPKMLQALRLRTHSLDKGTRERDQRGLYDIWTLASEWNYPDRLICVILWSENRTLVEDVSSLSKVSTARMSICVTSMWSNNMW